MKTSRPNRRRLSTLIPVVAALSLTLAACGSDDDANSEAPSTSAASDVATTDFNEADVEFSQGMIAHHEQAIEMAEIALDPAIAASAEVVDLATRIKAGQDPEIDLMTGWLTTWGAPVEMDTSEGHDMSSMDGTMTAEDMDALGAASGPDFDSMWLTTMIAHHEGAVDQALDVKAGGSNADVLTLADQIIAAQEGEIEEMQQLLGS